MTRFAILTILLFGCGGVQVHDHEAQVDLGGGAGDFAQASAGDAASPDLAHALDLAEPAAPDMAQAPDLAPTCGGEHQPCCGVDTCTADHTVCMRSNEPQHAGQGDVLFYCINSLDDPYNRDCGGWMTPSCVYSVGGMSYTWCGAVQTGTGLRWEGGDPCGTIDEGPVQ